MRLNFGDWTLLQAKTLQDHLGCIKAAQTNLTAALSDQKSSAEEEAAKAQEFENKVAVCSENLADLLPDGQEPNLLSSQDVTEMTDEDIKALEFKCGYTYTTPQAHPHMIQISLWSDSSIARALHCDSLSLANHSFVCLQVHNNGRRHA